MNSGVYKLTSPSGKVYIGQSINIKRRFAAYRNLAVRVRTQHKLFNALVKYGFDAFICEIVLYSEDVVLLNKVEREQIELHDSVVKGYNIRFGGDNHTLSDETRKKISSSNKGRKWSQESKQAFSTQCVGRQSPWKGCVNSKDKIRKTVATRCANNQYQIKDPQGQIHTVRNLAGFCRDNGLTCSIIRRILGLTNNPDHQIQHKGWTRPEFNI